MARADVAVGELVDIEVRITQVIDDHFPTFVECGFNDAEGTSHLFHVKLPVICEDSDAAIANLPRFGSLRATVIDIMSDASGRRCAKVSTDRPWCEESTAGRREFVILFDQLLRSAAKPKAGRLV